MSDITDLPAAWRARSAVIMSGIKAYNCRSMESTRQAMIKQAKQLEICADQLEAAISEAGKAEAASGNAQHSKAGRRGAARTQAHDGQEAASQEPAGQDSGYVDVPGMRSGNAGA